MLIPVKNRETLAINNSLVKKIYRNLTLDFIGVFEIYFLNQNNVKLTNHKNYRILKNLKKKNSMNFLNRKNLLFKICLRTNKK